MDPLEVFPLELWISQHSRHLVNLWLKLMQYTNKTTKKHYSTTFYTFLSLTTGSDIYLRNWKNKTFNKYLSLYFSFSKRISQCTHSQDSINIVSKIRLLELCNHDSVHISHSRDILWMDKEETGLLLFLSESSATALALVVSRYSLWMICFCELPELYHSFHFLLTIL